MTREELAEEYANGYATPDGVFYYDKLTIEWE